MITNLLKSSEIEYEIVVTVTCKDILEILLTIFTIKTFTLITNLLAVNSRSIFEVGDYIIPLESKSVFYPVIVASFVSVGMLFVVEGVTLSSYAEINVSIFIPFDSELLESFLPVNVLTGSWFNELFESVYFEFFNSFRSKLIVIEIVFV